MLRNWFSIYHQRNELGVNRRTRVERLYEFRCSCGKKLVWAIRDAKVLCNRCDNWVEFKDLENPKSYVVEIDKPEQLSMF